MLTISFYINIIFIVTAFMAIFFFYLASNKSLIPITILLTWVMFQSMLGFSGFYQITNTFPPRFIMLILPPIFLIIFIFLAKKGRLFIDNLQLKWLTIIHLVRLPIELVLYALFVAKSIPEVMTFEGRNFDIIMGITSPFIFYFTFFKNKLSSRYLLFWNIIGLIMVLNIAITGVLSSPFAFQKFGFEQPNIAVLHFPFNLLPALIVPLVIFSHMASIKKIIQTSIDVKRNENANVVIFPPLLFLLTLIIALIFKLIFPILSIPKPIQLIGFILIAIGLVILFIAIRQLNSHRTSIHPDGVTTKIVTNGIFRYSRNPIYVSFTLLYLGIILFMSALIGLFFLIPLLLITQEGIIKREEKYLTEKFKENYIKYKSSVRRWI